MNQTNAAENYEEVEELIRRARQGDREALGQLLEKNRDYLRGFTKKFLTGQLAARIDASDVIQQTCLSVYGNFDKFQGEQESEFVAWLQRVHEQNIQNVIRDHTQAQKRAVGRELPLDAGQRGAADLPQADQTTASQHAMRGEQDVELERMLERLPEDQREAVRLRHLEGWSLSKIAEQMERSESAVAGLLKRGMQTLRSDMNPEQ